MRYRFLSIGLGLFAGFLTIVLVEWIVGQMYPMPAEIDRSDIEAIEAYMRNEAPLASFIGIWVAYLLGALTSGFAAAWFEKRGPKFELRIAWITGAVLMAFGLMNLFMLPHPTWFWVASLLVFMPAAWLGGMLGSRLKPRAS